ncbi:MAG: hypothetical protein ACE5NG_15585 [bacterium]
MKKLFVILFILTACKSQLWAQQYLTLGVGFSVSFYRSDDLDHFKETYNLVNSQNLAALMKGITSAEGLRVEVGYRHLGRFGTAALVGLQRFSGKDLAQYNNREARRLDLKMNSLYVEYELGHTWNSFFVNGLVTVFLNRQLTLESVYSVPTGEVPKKSLTGTYKSDRSLSADLGIAVGIFRRPVFLIGKISYPIFTGGESSVLQDNSVEKIAEGTDIFPRDYVQFVNDEPYQGVASNIDGLKISLTVAFALPLKK